MSPAQIQGSNNGSVVLKNVSLETSGRYRCEATSQRTFQTVTETKEMWVTSGEYLGSTFTSPSLIRWRAEEREVVDHPRVCGQLKCPPPQLACTRPIDDHCLETHSRKLFPAAQFVCLALALTLTLASRVLDQMHSRHCILVLREGFSFSFTAPPRKPASRSSFQPVDSIHLKANSLSSPFFPSSPISSHCHSVSPSSSRRLPLLTGSTSSTFATHRSHLLFSYYATLFCVMVALQRQLRLL